MCREGCQAVSHWDLSVIELLWPVYMVLGNIRIHTEIRSRERRRLHVSRMGQVGKVRTMPAMMCMGGRPDKRVKICLVLQSLLAHLLARQTWWFRREWVDSRYGVATAVTGMLLRRRLPRRHWPWQSLGNGLGGLPSFLYSGRLRCSHGVRVLLRRILVAILDMLHVQLLTRLIGWLRTLSRFCGLLGRSRLFLLVATSCRWLGG